MNKLSLLAALIALIPGMSSADAVDDLVARARQMKLSESKQWHRLLHYRKALLGGVESEADGMKFFLSKDGKKNPEAELEATIRGFFKDEKPAEGDQHPQCMMPARRHWLEKTLGFTAPKLASADCARWENFRDKVAGKSATLVFSSYYLNNPASAFGHTLLRFNKQPAAASGERLELLDYGINYSAIVTTDNSLLYAIYGLTGLFKGSFTSTPYYYKVREYNDYESRDLWEYELNLNQEQVDMMVAHAWELGSTYFDYFYLSENCSYHILALIEAAIPETPLATQFGPYVIPADTIRVVAEAPGLVREVRFRPSVRMQFYSRLDKLSKDQKEQLARIVGARDPSLPAAMPAAERAQVLDAAIDYVDLKHFKDLIKDDKDAVDFKQRFLIARAKVGGTSPKVEVTPPSIEMPHLGHRTLRVGLEGGYSGEIGPFIRPSLRFALHDLLDARPGYPELAQIEFLNTRMRYNTREKSVWLEELDAFQVTSLSPLTEYDRKLSWRFRTGAVTLRDRNCDHCLAGTIDGGGGAAFRLPLQSIGYAMGEGDVSASPKLHTSKFRFGVGPKVGVRSYLTPQLAVLVEGSYRTIFPAEEHHTYAYGGQLRWSLTQNMALDLKQTRYPRESESSAGFYWYF